jgi:hypothetical protein
VGHSANIIKVRLLSDGVVGLLGDSLGRLLISVVEEIFILSRAYNG